MIYIAFIRGINVGGKNSVKMPLLAIELANNGFRHAKTYIQSGNIVLDTELGKEEVAVQIEKLLATTFDVDTKVIVREVDELKEIIAHCPYRTEDANSKIKMLYVYFLANDLDSSDLDRLEQYKDNDNMCRHYGDNLFLYCQEGLSASRLATQIAKVQPTYTCRNWNTVCKMVSMGEDMREDMREEMKRKK